MTDALHTSWHDLLRAWNVESARSESEFIEICRHYAEPHRHYHTIDHIASMLAVVDERLREYARNASQIRLAVWLHDVVYDSHASDNEERSAEYAVRLCERIGVECGPRLASLIMKTKIHVVDDSDPDAMVLLDADLAILGAAEPVYWAYAENIRREYSWVPEPTYRAGRRQVLERFLARPKIFHLLTELEAPARRNISAEVYRLADS